MKNRKPSPIAKAMIVTMLLSLSGGLACAAERAPMTPEMAAKREMVRKQQVQRITPQKRKAASDALKAERIKVHKARQDAQKLPPVNPDINK